MKKVFEWYNSSGILIVFFSFIVTLIAMLIFKNHEIVRIIGLITMIHVLFVVAIAASLYRKFYVDGYRLIPKGKHYPKHMYWPFVLKKNKELLINIEFTKACLYPPKYGKSKLFGLSFSILPRIRTRKICNKNGYRKDISILNLCIIFPHHWNSVRMAWKPVNEVINLYSYTYHKGKLKTILMGKVYDMSDVQQIDMIVKNGGVLLSINFSKYEHIKCKAKFCWYYLGLFFGGKYKAPHDIHMKMKRLT